MSALVQEFLSAWESELLQLRANDPLIHLTDSSYITDASDLWKQDTQGGNLLRELKRIDRERGVIALVQFEGILHWKKGDRHIQTPVFLKECSLFHLHTQKVEFEEKRIVNPFLSVFLQRNKVTEIDFEYPESAIDGLLGSGLFQSYEAKTGYANLHPQRYELRREWEALQATGTFSSALKQIIGDSHLEESLVNSTELQPIFSLDPDQHAAVKNAMVGSEVIFGPPGTGKSVVLSCIISQAILKQETALVVSDKPVALEVLIGKLAQHGLHNCCVFLNPSQPLAGFFKQLRSQFERLIQTPIPTEKTSALTLLAERFWEERSTIERYSNTSLSELLHFFGPPTQTSSKPSRRWQNYLTYNDLINQLPKPTRVLLPLLTKFWQESSSHEIQYAWKTWQDMLKQLQQIDRIDSQATLDLLVEQSLRCIQFEGNVYQVHRELLDLNPGPQLKLLLQFQETLLKEEQLSKQLKVWKQIPTLAEWELLKLSAKNSGWWANRKWRNLEKTWLRLPGLDIKQLEKNLIQYWKLLAKKGLLREKFTRFGIVNLEEACSILIPLLKHHQPEQWQWYRSLDRSVIQTYCQAHQVAHHFQQLHRELFTNLAPDFSVLQKSIQKEFDSVMDAFAILKQIPFELWEIQSDQTKFKEVIRAEFWADLRFNYPEIYSHSDLQITELIEADLMREEKNWHTNAEQILEIQRAKFDALQSILTAPLSKLSIEEKRQRPLLRKGKAILVKEMAKTRQHLSIVELLKGPAAPWLRIIFPIWCCTPTTLAKILPMHREFFELGIFDEASQLPLSHAIGALQRVKKCIIAGDPQQMRPQSYFGQSNDGVVDLLHQAAFYLPNTHLRYHYRSEDPRLIAFSNRHFYENSLLVWPSRPNKENGIFDHFVEEGRYFEQQNQKEAAALVKQLRKLLFTPYKIGVVAFSEQQLGCIYKQLHGTEKSQLEQRIQDRSAFFLPLEKVQGEECEILLISFGFGKNESDQFNLHLGPMTQAQSGRRLNVLLTRAQKALHFYSSIRSTDFPPNRSEATNRIWEWFIFMEAGEIEQFTYNAKERLSTAKDYATFLNFYRVLKQRGTLPLDA